MAKRLSALVEGLVFPAVESKVRVEGLTTDSRLVHPGDLFLAYPGLTQDGRDYIPEALQRGACAILYEPGGFWSAENAVLLPVPSLQRHVSHIAGRFYDQPSQHLTVIGVTGTNGKTSCTQFLAQALNAWEKSCGVIGTIGYGFLPNLVPMAWTTPEAIFFQSTLAQMRLQGAKFVATEVSSQALHQYRVAAVDFDVAVFTQLSREHLDYHGTLEEYARAKMSLFQAPALRYRIINLDDPLSAQIRQDPRGRGEAVGYSIHPHTKHTIACVQATQVIPQTGGGFQVSVCTPWGKGEFQTSMWGEFNVSNLLAVLATLGVLNIPLSHILNQMEHLTAPKGRMQILGGGSDNGQNKPRIVIDYAHTPEALQKVLETLRSFCQGRLVCVFGCGGDRDRGKRPQMAAIAERYADYVILTNDNPRCEDPFQIVEDIQMGFTKTPATNRHVCLDRDKAIQDAVQKASIDDIVLIAGKGHETAQIIGDRHFSCDDSQIAQGALRRWQGAEKNDAII